MKSILLNSIISLALACHICFAQVPAIGSFTPNSGPVGTIVTITGSNFNASPASNIVFFGATRALVTTASTTSLKVTVPQGATYQPITVLNANTGLLACSAKPFIVTFNGEISATFLGSKVDFATGKSPQAVSIGDLDGDGKPDLAIANYSSNSVSVLRNVSTINSNLWFESAIDFDAGTRPSAVGIGDLDGDGKPELAVANYGSNTISVLRNTSTINKIDGTSFAHKVDFATGFSPCAIVLNDFDGDGKSEMAVANRDGYSVSVLHNTVISGVIDSASFAEKVDFGANDKPNSLSVGDLDGDGKKDIVVANSYSNTISILRNSASPGALTYTSFEDKFDITTGLEPSSVAIADLDGDDKADIAVANSGSNTFSVFKNLATLGSLSLSSFSTPVDFATGPTPYFLNIGDMDGDGKQDVVVINDVVISEGSSNSVSIFKNTSLSGAITAASFAKKIDFVTGNTPVAVSIGDLDGDSLVDMAIANNFDNTISIYKNKPFPTVTSIQSENRSMKSDHVSIFPNPAIRTFTIETDAFAGEIRSIEVFSLDGNVVMKKENLCGTTYLLAEANNLLQGVYMLRIVTENTQEYVIVTKQ